MLDLFKLSQLLLIGNDRTYLVQTLQTLVVPLSLRFLLLLLRSVQKQTADLQRLCVHFARSIINDSLHSDLVNSPRSR